VEDVDVELVEVLEDEEVEELEELLLVEVEVDVDELLDDELVLLELDEVEVDEEVEDELLVVEDVLVEDEVEELVDVDELDEEDDEVLVVEDVDVVDGVKPAAKPRIWMIWFLVLSAASQVVTKRSPFVMGSISIPMGAFVNDANGASVGALTVPNGRPVAGSMSIRWTTLLSKLV